MTPFLLPSGRSFTTEGALRKLALRASLPGAFLFDRAAQALRLARAQAIPLEARLDLAFSASWLVNSPAPSTTLHAWSKSQRDVLCALASRLEGGETLDEMTLGAVAEAVELLASALGERSSQGAEAVSKLLALVVPEGMPLLPEPACRFLLGEAIPERSGARFVACLPVFWAATDALYMDLVDVAKEYPGPPLDAAQVLDRLLWFDSEGYRHFEKTG